MTERGEGEDEREKWRPKRNLLILSAAFLLNFSAYGSLEMIQSSLNSEIGTMSLSATYASLLVSALVLPPLFIDRLGYRNSMGLGALAYAVYTAANYYPQPYTLIPAGIILGAGGAVLWAAQRVYLTNLGLHLVGKVGKKSEKKVGYYFGIFHSFYSLSAAGNIIMSLALTSVPAGSQDTVSSITQRSAVYNTTFPTMHDTSTTRISAVSENITCGIPASFNWEQGPNKEDGGTDAGVNLTMLYVLLSVYLCFSVLAALLLFFALDEVPEFKPGIDGASTTARECEISEKYCDAETILTEGTSEKVPEEEKEHPKASGILRATRPGSSRTLLLAVLRLTLNSRQLQLIIPSTVHFGILHTLMSTHFMRFWVTCSLGIGYVGYVALVFGVVSSGISYIVGHLLRWFRRETLYACSCLLEIGCLVTIMMWSPPKDAKEQYAFFLWVGCVSAAYTTQRCINSTAFSAFFMQDKDAAQSALAFWDSLGRAIIFALAPIIGVAVQVYVISGFLAVGGTLYFIAERRHAKAMKKKNQSALLLDKPPGFSDEKTTTSLREETPRENDQDKSDDRPILTT